MDATLSCVIITICNFFFFVLSLITPFGSSLPRCQLHWKKLPTLYDATNKIVAVLSLLEHRLKNYIKNGTSVNYREIALSLMGTHKDWMKVTGDP